MVVSLRWPNEYMSAVEILRGPDQRQIRFKRKSKYVIKVGLGHL